jgi:hypothetical protein
MVKSEIKSGLRLGIGLGLFLVGAMLLGNGMERAVWSAVPLHYVVWPEPIGWTELTVAAALLTATAGVWWQLLAGYIVIGTLKSFLILLTGKDLFAPYPYFSRLEAFELMIFGLSTLLLMLRFTKQAPIALDRITLTVYLFCLMWRADRIEFSSADPALIAGVLILLIPYSLQQWRVHKSKVVALI